MARVLVIGPGAIGGLLAALLREARHDVVALGRPADVEVIVRDGLLLTGGAYGPPRRVPLKAGPRAPPGFAPDLVILAVKTQDLAAAIAEHGPWPCPVVALQNGLAQDALVPDAVPCVVALDAERVAPGHVHCARKGTLLLGRHVPALADAVRVKLARNVEGARWTKLLVNLGNVIPALTGLTFQEAAAHPGLATAHVRMIREGVAVADASRVTLAPLPWTSPALVRALARLPDPLARRAYRVRVRAVLGSAPARGSTWQSAEQGKAWETPWLNGEIVRRGEALGVPTPVNARALDLVGKRIGADECAQLLLAVGHAG